MAYRVPDNLFGHSFRQAARNNASVNVAMAGEHGRRSNLRKRLAPLSEDPMQTVDTPDLSKL